jgi:HK97 family phage major capsid protein
VKGVHPGALFHWGNIMITNIDKLRKQRGGLLDEMKAIHDGAEKENRDLNEAEAKAWGEKKAAAEALASRIERALVIEGNEARGATEVREPIRPGIPKFYPAHRLKSFRRGTDAEKVEAAYRSGMFLAATLFGQGWAKEWCKEQGIGLHYERWQDPEVQGKAMTEGSNPVGGFLVPTEFENSVIDLRETFGVFRGFARNVLMMSDTKTQPRRTGGLTAYPIGEAGTITASDKNWDQVSLTARKWGVLCRYSSELNEDAIISMADDLAGEIAYAFAITEDDCGWNGDGSAAYHNILGARTKIVDPLGSGQKAGAVDAAAGHDTFAEIDATDLSKVMAACPIFALPTAKWYVSQVGKTLVFDRLTQAGGGNTKADLGGRAVDAYQGYPIVISNRLPMVQTDISDTAMLFFGDLAMACMFGDRRGVLVAGSEHVYFTTDELAIRGTERFDINVHGLGDIVSTGPTGNVTTGGPLVALIAE